MDEPERIACAIDGFMGIIEALSGLCDDETRLADAHDLSLTSIMALNG